MPCKDPDHMEEPVLCGCREWFELSEGFRSERTNFHGTNIVCPNCHEEEVLEDEREQLDDHVRHNNIKGHSINADGSCNMGCC